MLFTSTSYGMLTSKNMTVIVITVINIPVTLIINDILVNFIHYTNTVNFMLENLKNFRPIS